MTKAHGLRPSALVLLSRSARSARLALLALMATAPGCSAPEYPPPDSVEAVVARIDALREQITNDPLLNLPVSFAAAGTATQKVPVSLLASGFPDAPDITMTHPVFVAKWRDGRQLVIDPGLATEACPGFGAPSEWLGAEEIACAGEADPWAQGIDPGSVSRVVFSHLHVDHVSGVSEICRLCDETPCRLPVALSALQEGSEETHEISGREWLDAEDVAACIVRERLEPDSGDDGTPHPIATDLPGAWWMPIPGHTPGSQLIFVFRRDETGVRAMVVAGDVVNYAPALCADGHPKPGWYRTLLVREDEARQAWNRRLLRELDARGYEIHVSHDLAAERTDGRLCPGS